MTIQEIQLKTDIEFLKEDIMAQMFNFPGLKKYLDKALKIIFDKKIKSMVEETGLNRNIEEYDRWREEEIIKELENNK